MIETQQNVPNRYPETAGVETPVCTESLQYLRQYRFRAGSQIAILPSSGGVISIIALGAVRLESILNDGRRQVYGFGFRGERLYDIRGNANLRYVALSDGVINRIAETYINRCGQCHLDTEDARNGGIVDFADGLTTQVFLLGSCTATERMTAFLTDLADRIGRRHPKGIAFPLAMKRDDIADFLGLNTETVSRQFGRLRRSGIVELPKPGRVIVRDRTALAALSPFAAQTPLDAACDAA